MISAGFNLEQSNDLRRQREDRFLGTMLALDKSFIPFPDEPGIEYPKLATWKVLTKYRKERFEVSDIPDGIRFRFVDQPGLLSDLARIIEQEQDCCNFLRFELTIEPSAGPITFDVTGPPGTVEMLRKL